MIKENEDYKIFQKRNLRKRKRIMIRPAIAKHGIMTKYGLKCFRDRMVMEGNHNLLFGTEGELPVGICLRNEFSNRNLNAVILEGNTHKGWENYTLPNLLAGHSSSVVVGSEKDLEAVTPVLLKKGVNLYLMQFGNGAISNRYNPFLHQTKFEIHMMAETCAKFFHKAKDEIAKAYFGDEQSLAEGIYRSFLDFTFLYTGLSKAIEDSERTFQTVRNVLLDIRDNGIGQIARYIVPESELIAAQIHNITENVNSIVQKMLSALLSDIEPLTQCQTFEESEIPQLNVTVDKLVNEPTCILIPIPEAESERHFMELYLFMFLEDLYAYGDKNRAYCGAGRDQALKNPVCFYLNEFASYKIPHFLNYLATCRRYGIGLSVIVHSVQEIRSFYPMHDKGFDDAECLFANVDTFLALAVKNEADYAHLSEQMLVPVDIDGKEIPERKLRRISKWWCEHCYRTIPAYTKEELQKLICDGKAIVIVRDCYPIICNILTPEDLNRKRK